MMTAVSIAGSQVDSFHTTVKVFGPFRTSCPHHRASRSPAPAGRTWPLALLVFCAGIHRFSRSREGRPRRSRRDNIGSSRFTSGTRGRGHPTSWSIAAAFDRQGKAIGCEPPARDERVCSPGGKPSRVKGYRSFLPSGRPGWLPTGSPYSVRVRVWYRWRTAWCADPTILCSALCTFGP